MKPKPRPSIIGGLAPTMVGGGGARLVRCWSGALGEDLALALTELKVE